MIVLGEVELTVLLCASRHSCLMKFRGCVRCSCKKHCVSAFFCCPFLCVHRTIMSGKYTIQLRNSLKMLMICAYCTMYRRHALATSSRSGTKQCNTMCTRLENTLPSAQVYIRTKLKNTSLSAHCKYRRSSSTCLYIMQDAHSRNRN